MFKKALQTSFTPLIKGSLLIVDRCRFEMLLPRNSTLASLESHSCELMATETGLQSYFCCSQNRELIIHRHRRALDFFVADSLLI